MCGGYADQVDHLRAASRLFKAGWPVELVDHPDNLAAICRKDNRAKSDKTLGAGGNWVNPKWR